MNDILFDLIYGLKMQIDLLPNHFFDTLFMRLMIINYMDRF